MEQLKVLAAALALRSFTVDEISGLSGVNPRTVRSVLRRNSDLIGRVAPQPAGQGPVGAAHGRGRPVGRWKVVDSDQIRQLVREAEAMPSFEPHHASAIGAADADLDDVREAAVAVAEAALSKVGTEPDEAIQWRLITSARSSLYFGNDDDWADADPSWWEVDDSQFAVRARGVDALAALADAVQLKANDGAPAGALAWAQLRQSTAGYIAAAMQASPERGEEIYFTPLSHILAHSGEFAPLFAVCAPGQNPAFPFVGDWAEAEPADFQFKECRVLTQPWALPFVNVSSSMPIVVSLARTGYSLDPVVQSQLFNSVRFAPRPAAVFDPLNRSEMIKETGRVGASYLHVGRQPSDRRNAIEAVSSLIDRFSAGR